MRRSLGESGMIERETRLALAQAAAEMPELTFAYDGSGQSVSERVGPDGKKVMVFCRTAMMASAKDAIASARREIESDRDLSRRECTEALRALDEAMREVGRTN